MLLHPLRFEPTSPFWCIFPIFLKIWEIYRVRIGQFFSRPKNFDFFNLQNVSYDICWDFLFVSSVDFFVISCVFVGLRWQQRLPRAYFCLLRATPQLKLVKTSTATQTVFSAIQCIIRPASLAFFPCAALLDVFTTDFLHKHQFKACLAIIKNP